MVKRASCADPAAALGADAGKVSKYGRAGRGTGACAFVTLAHETFECARPAALAFLNNILVIILGRYHAAGVPAPRDVGPENHLVRRRRTPAARRQVRALQVRECGPLMVRLMVMLILMGRWGPPGPTGDLFPLSRHHTSEKCSDKVGMRMCVLAREVNYLGVAVLGFCK